MRMYTLIMAEKASKGEQDGEYKLDEALKLYALYDMGQDIQRQRADERREQ